MTITRRGFLKGTAVTTGGALALKALAGGLETLTPAAEAGQVLEETWVPTTCWIGKQDCGMLARKVNGRVVKFEGHPANPRNQGTLCPKGMGQIIALYDPNRVKTPLIRTNEKGVPGEWRQATWEEALSLVAEKVREVRERDPELLVWQKGRSKAKPFYDKAFVKATGAVKLHHGAYCSDTGYRALEYTIGTHAVLHPDMKHTRLILSWGWNITAAGGNKLCWLTWPQQLVVAKERGAKVIAIDPRLRSAAHFADDWVPIRPGTDLAFILALCNLLIQGGTLDRPYLKTYTNAPYLVGEDGFFLRRDGQPLVWDQVSGRAVPAGMAGADPALEGEYEVDGVKAKPAFQRFKEQVAEYTPAKAAEICGIDADQVERVAKAIADNAMIGSTVVVDGVEVPYRPVGIMAYHMAQQELGFQTVRGLLLLMMLIGAIGAAGGQLSDFTWKIHKNYQALDEIEIEDPPYNIYLKNSPFWPINSNNSSIVAKAMLEPDRYGVEKVPEVVILHMVNPLASFADQPLLMEAYKKFKFVVAIDAWLSKTADLFADVVLPAATVEKYEGPLSAVDQYTDAVTLRVPPVEPLFQSRGEIDIYLDLCERIGVLYGEGGYLDQINKALKLEGEYALPLDRKPTVREIFDRWAKAQGVEEGVAYFEQNGVYVKGPISPRKMYGYVTDPPFGGVMHRFYGESLLRYREEMRARGMDEIYWQDYLPLPQWRPPTMEKSPPEYDLVMISYKMIEFKQSRASQIPLLAELAPRAYVEIHPKTARAKGIGDGDEVWVESHNAVTGETRRVKVVARYRESIRPDVLGFPHHYGEVARHPWAEGQGPTSNTLFFTGEGYVAMTADQSFQVKVKVYKA